MSDENYTQHLQDGKDEGLFYRMSPIQGEDEDEDEVASQMDDGSDSYVRRPTARAGDLSPLGRIVKTQFDHGGPCANVGGAEKSKSSTATTPKIPTPLLAKSAWSRGPPQTATTPTLRSQSPAPSTPTHRTHSRRPSTLGQGVPTKDGVSVPRSNVGAVKQGSAVTFGSIDDVSAPISSLPAAPPPTKSEGVKSFGSVPATSAMGHVNGKASISSRTSVVPPAASSSSSAASTPPPSAAAVPQAKPKIDIKKMFQNPSSAPSSTPSSDSSSPSLRNAPLPSQPSSSHQGQSTHPQPSQLAHSFTPFVPSSQTRPPQNSDPNGGPPRSPQYSRQNANGPRAQGGQNGGPSSASISRLNAGTNGFVLRAKVTLKKEDGTEVHLENLSRSNLAPVPTSTATQSPQASSYRHGSPLTPTRRPASIRIESEDQRKKRLAEEKQNEKEKAKLKAESDEKAREAREEREEAQSKVKEVEEKKRLKEEAEKDCIRKEEEAKKEQRRIKLEEEERIRKEAEEREAQPIRDEEERIPKEAEAKRLAAFVCGAAGMQFSNRRPTLVIHTVSQGGPGSAPHRECTRAKCGAGVRDLEPAAPLQVTENRWVGKIIAVDADSPEMVNRKIKGLLNKLTMEKFDSISDQIISWANKSEKEKDGRTLIKVIRLVFEHSIDDERWSEMFARLCRKMMEQISPKVQDYGIKNNEGKPIAGGQLFRKHLLNRCQEDFERGWMTKEAETSKAVENNAAAKAASEKPKKEEAALYSDEYYAAQKAKRQGLGLIKFIGELFKLQMLTERLMHECVKKLLGNVDNPEEEEIESLCKLLTTVGGILDTPKARAHMNVYFSRMKELTKGPNVSSRVRYMLIVSVNCANIIQSSIANTLIQDLIELRDRKWVSRTAVAAPTTIAQIHENAAKEKAAAEKVSYNRQASMSLGGSRRGGDRGDFSPVGSDGWAVDSFRAARLPPKAGDFSNFGRISKTQPMTFGPSSVFAGKKGADAKRESLSRTSSSSNMFSMLSSQAAETTDAATKVFEPTQRRRLVLQPRSKPVDSETAEPPADGADGSEAGGSEAGGSEPEATVEMSEADAKKKIAEDSKEFFAVRNLDEAEVYFSALPPSHHHLLVDTLVLRAVESKEADAQLVADFFARTVKTKRCDAAAFEAGMMNTAEIIDDIAIDAPKALQLFATMMKGADLDETRRTNLASKSMDSEKLLGLIGVRDSPTRTNSATAAILQSKHKHSSKFQCQITALNDAELVHQFLERLVRAGTCSTALLQGKKEDAIMDIVQEIQDCAPNALEKLSLMIKGAGLEHVDGK